MSISKSDRFEAEAPSNIALIKYMGKDLSSSSNRPLNSSISYTLNHLKTKVSIELTTQANAQWKALDSNFELSTSSVKKFLIHWDRLHQKMAPHFNQGVIIHSGNNFPSDCGLASSASSFAALTMATHKLFKDLNLLEREWTTEELCQLSQQGSGSSCRSFFNSWALWSNESTRSIDTVWNHLLHSVVIVDGQKKKVSSSEAHARVLTSSLFEGRIQRAHHRANQLMTLLKQTNTWSQIFELCWAEFWDMHLLFETSSPQFYYMKPKSLLALRWIQDQWELKGDGPLVTMDAGPNIHLLYREDQKDLQFEQNEALRQLDFPVISTLDQ